MLCRLPLGLSLMSRFKGRGTRAKRRNRSSQSVQCVIFVREELAAYSTRSYLVAMIRNFDLPTCVDSARDFFVHPAFERRFVFN